MKCCTIYLVTKIIIFTYTNLVFCSNSRKELFGLYCQLAVLGGVWWAGRKMGSQEGKETVVLIYT